MLHARTVAFVLLGCGISHAAETRATAKEPVIQMRATLCAEGQCPEYLLQIFSDGTIVYVGLRNVEKIGVVRSELSASALVALIREFEAAGFFKLEDEYRTTTSDLSATEIRFRRGTNSKTAFREHDMRAAPDALVKLERAIEDAVRVERWIGEDQRRNQDWNCCEKERWRDPRGPGPS